MRYELLIQKKGSYIPLDLGGEDPVMVLQVSALTELKDIHTSYSQALRLPKSGINCEAFDYADDFQARSGVPYAVYPCALYCDGARIVPDGFRLVVKSVEGWYFRCQIISNVRGLFTPLADLSLADLGLPLIPYTIEEINASSTGNRDYVFALDGSHRVGDVPTIFGFRDSLNDDDAERVAEMNRNEYGLIMVNTFWPYYKLRVLVEKIFAAQGYTLDAPVADAPGYKDIFVSLADMKPSAMSFDPLLATATGSLYITPSMALTPQYLLKEAVIDDNYGELDTTSLQDSIDLKTKTYGVCYTATDCVKIRVRIKTVSLNGWDFAVRYCVRKYGITISDTNPGSNQDVLNITDWESVQASALHTSNKWMVELPDGIWESDVFDLAPGEKVYIESNTRLAPPGDTITTNVSIVFDENTPKVPAGGIIDPGINFGFENQLEAVKLFVQLHGLTVQVDSDAKVVAMHPFAEIVEKAQNEIYADWSDKIDESRTQEVAFTLDGYAQRNDVRFRETDGFQDTAGILVGNSNIAAERVLMDIAADSAQDRELPNPVRRQAETQQLYAVRPRYTRDTMEAVYYITQDSAGRTFWPQTTYAEGRPLINVCPLWNYNAPGMALCQIDPVIMPGVAPFVAPRVGYLPYNMQPVSATRVFLLAKAARGIPISYFVETYYKALQDHVLDKVRVLTAYFYLTPADIARLDYLTPVYIEKYGQYFFIQKIDNYRAGAVTKVTLVAINL